MSLPGAFSFSLLQASELHIDRPRRNEPSLRRRVFVEPATYSIKGDQSSQRIWTCSQKAIGETRS